ncbi:MAG: hypothetical protein ACLFSK_08315 [Ectothiorhodospira sp.]
MTIPRAWIPGRPGRCTVSWVLCLWAILMATPVQGARITLDIGALEGSGVAMEGVRGRLDTGGAGAPHLTLRVDRLRLPPPVGPLEDLRLDCPGGRLGMGGLACPDLRMVLPGPGTVTGRLHLERDGRLDLDLDPFPLAGGEVGLRLRGTADDWRARVRVRGMEVSDLAEGARRRGQPLPDWTLAGRLDLDLTLRGRGARPRGMAGRLAWRDGGFGNPVGTLAGEGLDLVLEGSARATGSGWTGTLEADARSGGAYLDPVFLDLEAHALSLGVEGGWDGAQLRVDDLRLDWGSALSLEARGEGRPEAFPEGFRGRLDLKRARFPEVYEGLLRPFVRGTVLGDLETAGALSARMDWDGRPLRAAVTVSGLFADDRRGRLGLYDADGRLLWDARGGAPTSHLGFQGGHLYRIPLGMTRVALQLESDGVYLPGEIRIPVLDGALQVHALSLQGLDAGDPELAFEASLMPVSMGLLAAHLGMPPFSGTLSGSIPRVHYRDGVLSGDGRLVVRAFDGQLVARDLTLREPFGVAPVLTGEVALDGLDLAAVTDTFEFGRIQGRLEGYARDLEWVNWTPVHFDAALYTPLEGRFPRRISQQALDTLVDLGGGVGGVLGGGFLRFFDTFGYRQLGLACRLEGDVCRMRGVAPGPEGQGYYIVQGAGLPRVNVIGHTRRVAWRDLLSRLATALEQGAAKGEDPGP